MREIFNSEARPRVDGRRWPGRNCPARIARRNHSETCWYIGILPQESRATGGKKLGEILFIPVSGAL